MWGGACSNALKPLQTMINKAVRIISFAPFGNLDLTPAYKQLRLLSLENKLELGKFTYKLKNNLLRSPVGNYFEFSSEQTNHSHFVRNRHRPIRLLCNSRTGEKSVQFKSFKLWIEIPLEIKNSESFTMFKKLFKKHLID